MTDSITDRRGQRPSVELHPESRRCSNASRRMSRAKWNSASASQPPAAPGAVSAIRTIWGKDAESDASAASSDAATDTPSDAASDVDGVGRTSWVNPHIRVLSVCIA